MRIATWNVNGIRARQEQIREWIEKDRPEVICLQEIKALPEQVPASLRELEGYWSHWHGGKGYSGVALMIRKDLSAQPPQFSHPFFDVENRIVTALIGDLTVASVYVPNGGKDFRAKMRFLNALQEYAAAFHSTGDGLIFCGDLNVTRAEIDVHPQERRNVICQLPQEREAFAGILSSGMVDIARTLEPSNENLFTWWAPWRGMRQRNIGWRLDYLLATADLANRARSCSVLIDIGTSDHAPVIATFE